MPEFQSALLRAYTPEPPKKPAIIKVTCGIGDTDGFPAFDVESDAYATKDDSKWGFLITGGAEFHMPLTVFQVSPDGLADKGGIRLGDIILEINEEDATQLTLAQAHERINAAGKKIHFLLKSMEDEDTLGDYEPGEEKSIVLRVPKPPPPPKVASIEARLREMQRKLAAIAEIPKILSSTLATVSQTFDKLAPQHPKDKSYVMLPQCRKYSYDEDAIDYELSDDHIDNNDVTDEDVEVDDDDDDDDEEEYTEDDAVTAEVNEQVRRMQHILRVRKTAAPVKEITPESDYSSEANYGENEEDASEGEESVDTAATSENEAEVDSDSDGNMGNNANAVFYAKNYERPAPQGYKPDVHPQPTAEEDEDTEFLSTTFTWHMRNAPKLSQHKAGNKLKGKEREESVGLEDDVEMSGAGGEQSSTSDELLKLEKQDKLDKLERSWPWADREKIIYKQSTCHLVPRKPLGLVEKRIQLLAKQQLIEKLQRGDVHSAHK